MILITVWPLIIKMEEAVLLLVIVNLNRHFDRFGFGKPLVQAVFKSFI